MDDFLELLDSNDGLPDSKSARRNQGEQSRTLSTVTPESSSSHAIVDEKVGIRMTKRVISSLCLGDMLASNPYHAPASIAAASLATLNRVLVEPASVLDAATVCGNTNLITVGIVFSNSGTRVASSGNAYCMVSIGNLRTGPCVSLLLFGSPYQKHCKTLLPGKVVAVLSPRLMPSKPGNMATFSLSHDEQLTVVADAKDFGVCRARLRGQNAQGQWVSDAKPCRNYVDTSISHYCKKHAVEKQKKANQNSSTTTVKRLLAEAHLYPTMQAKSNRPHRLKLTTWQDYVATRRMGNESSNMNAEKSNVRNCISQNTSRQETTQQLSSIASCNASQFNHNRVHTSLHQNSKMCPQPMANKSRTTLAPHDQLPIHQDGRMRLPLSTNTNSRAFPAHQDWLKASSKRQSVSSLANTANRKRQRAVNTVGVVGFDGSVAIPKPSVVAAVPASSRSSKLMSNPAKMAQSQSEILAKQKALALKHRLQKNQTAATSIGRTDANHPKGALKESLYGSIGNIDKDTLLTASSRFSEQANSENFVRSRQVVEQLEKDEGRKEQLISRNKNQDGPIEKNWFCDTCKRSFQFEPTLCIRRNHRLKCIRGLKSSTSTEDERVALTKKSVEDGGLTLGSGLEWSQWKKGH